MLQAVKITPEPQKATGDKTVLTGSLFQFPLTDA